MVKYSDQKRLCTLVEEAFAMPEPQVIGGGGQSTIVKSPQDRRAVRIVRATGDYGFGNSLLNSVYFEGDSRSLVVNGHAGRVLTSREVGDLLHCVGEYDALNRVLGEDQVQQIAGPHRWLSLNGSLHMALPYQFVDGKTLKEYLSTEEVSLRDVVKIGSDIINALEVNWTRGIINRDVKPDNVIITKDAAGVPHATLIDYGIATVMLGSDIVDPHMPDKTALLHLRSKFSDSVRGTLRYVAPEAFLLDFHLDAQPARDLFSLGALLYEISEGETPFEREASSSSVVNMALNLRDYLSVGLSRWHEFTERLGDSAIYPTPYAHAIAGLLHPSRDERYKALLSFKFETYRILFDEDTKYDAIVSTQKDSRSRGTTVDQDAATIVDIGLLPTLGKSLL